MTILFTAGYPFSGKTEFATLLTKALEGNKKAIHIDPQSLRPPEYNTLNPQKQADARIAAWEVSQEMLVKSMGESADSLVIFDTCAAKSKVMLQHFVTAAANHHEIYYVFVGATLQECRERAGDKWPKAEIIQQYANDFVDSIPQLRKASDRFFFIKNNKDEARAVLKSAVNKISDQIVNGQNRVHQPKPIFGPVSRTGQKNDKRTKVR